MPLYLRLLNGRMDLVDATPDPKGVCPVFGPCEHMVCKGHEIKFHLNNHPCCLLTMLGPEKNLVYYDGVFYEEWVVFDQLAFNNTGELNKAWAPFNSDRAKPPPVFPRPKVVKPRKRKLGPY